MKKSISIILAALMLLSVFSITASATNGPKPNMESGSASLYFRNVVEDTDDIILLSSGEIHNDAIEGAEYDSESNTLTLNDFSHPNLALFLEDMGDDFTLNIKGECKLFCITLSTDDYGANLNVTGDGLLVVNPEREDECAIRFRGVGAQLKLHVDNSVSVKFLSSENAVLFNGSSNSDKDTVFTQGEETVNVEGGKGKVETALIIKGAYSERDNFTKTGYQAHMANDPNYENGLFSVTISENATGDIYHVEKYIISDKFGVWVKDESFEAQDLSKEEFDAEYVIETHQGSDPKTVTYLDENDEEQTGFLMHSSTPGEENQEFVIDIDFNKDYTTDVHWARPIEKTPTGGYRLQATWMGYEVNGDSYYGRGLGYVYGEEYTEFEKPSIATGEFEVYEDAEGNRYVFGENDDVYRISEDDKVTIDGVEYYVLRLWQGVTKDNLIPVTQEVEDNYYNYEYPAPDYIHEAEIVDPSDTGVVTEDTTAVPEETTDVSEETTDAPEGTTADAEGTTAAVEETTDAPVGTTADAEGTTAAVEETTDAPEGTTADAEGTTAAPEGTTAAPEGTTSAQNVTTSPITNPPVVTTTAPEKTTKDTSATKATTPKKSKKTNTTKKTTKKTKSKVIKKGATKKQVDKIVRSLKTEKDPKGTKFGLLCAHQKKATKKSVTVKWNKLKKAKYYLVYGSLCGTKKGKIPPYKKIKKTKKTSYTKKKLKKGTYFKFLIIAFDKKNKVLASSKTVHIATKGGKVGNDKTVKLNKSKVTLKLKKKKTFKIKAKEIPKSKKLKVKRHRKIKYESSNPKVAKVNKKGKVTAKKKGKATIFVYAQNGLYKKLKVVVKKK